MKDKHSLMIEQLDQKFKPFAGSEMAAIPESGWIHAIRKTLNMTLEQLGRKLGISRQGAKKLEVSEAKGGISLNSLKEVANALEMKLVYAIIPKEGSIDKFIDRKAEDLAKKIVLRTNQSMILEDQSVGSERLQENIQDLAAEIKREMRRTLWD